MKSWANLALKSCFLTCLAFSGVLWGQAAVSNPSNGASAAAPSSAAQHDPLLAKAHADDSYIIGEDDVLSISVWNEANLTRVIPVRSDGKISLPLVGDVQAAGRTPSQLQQDLTADLQSFITDPQVTIIVQEIRSRKFNILGEINRPGSYALDGGMTVVDAIALAGGFKDFAKRKSVYILRQNVRGEDTRIAFNYPQFIKGKNTSQNIKLRPHDIIVVP